MTMKRRMGGADAKPIVFNEGISFASPFLNFVLVLFRRLFGMLYALCSMLYAR